MHSFLVCSKNKQTALEYALAECKKNKIDKFDISLLSFEKSIGIEDVRNFQKKLILKPFKSKEKAVILESFNGITIEAQNALLKLLEEPPQHTIIYVTAQNKELMLPTILSRCKIVDLKDKNYELSKKESAQYLNILISLSTIGVGKKLKLAQDIAKNKDDIIPELEKMIIVARSVLLSSFWGAPLSGATPESLRTFHDKEDSGQARMTASEIKSYYLKLLVSLQKTHTILKTTNVSPRLALENLFLNL
jgi:DNA polymerase III delta prime subunit